MAGAGVKLAAASAVAVVMAGGVKTHGGHGIIADLTSAHHHPAASQAIAYVRHQIGKPYCRGGTGPSCYDCSGLVMEGWASAGVHIPRTTFQQYPALPHVPARHLRPGDLVYGVGADGTATSPGHVGMYLGHGRVIQAYATGSPVMVSSLGAFGAAAGGIVGYARPGGA
jgi:cell wall-associated NlpC family hydrolase